MPARRFGPASALSLPALLLVTAAASAQTTGTAAAEGPSEATATAAAPLVLDAGHALLLAFGNQAGLARLSERVLERLRADGRIERLAPGGQSARLKQQLTDQFCQALDAGCTSAGPADADWPALAGALRDAMEAQAVPPAAQEALLARLAPQRTRVVSR